MQKRTSYTLLLKQKPEADWDAYLLIESGLPGPRANLELIQAAADAGSLAQFERWLAWTPERAGVNTPEMFLPCCAAVGLGRLAAEGHHELLETLRELANDPRWRMREAVAMALQRLGEADLDALFATAQVWSAGTPLQLRAAVAGLCEPALLCNPEHTKRVLSLMDCITTRLSEAPAPRGEDWGVLRQALGYAWSVAAVADWPAARPLLESWAASTDRDVRWVLRENLKKSRLTRCDAGWVTMMKKRLG